MVMIFAEAERSNQCKSVAETDGACVYIMGWQPCGRVLTGHFACCVRAMPCRGLPAVILYPVFMGLGRYLTLLLRLDIVE